MTERRPLPEDDEPIRLDHDTVLDRLEAYRRRSAIATDDLVDLTLLESRADLVVLPEADDERGS